LIGQGGLLPCVGPGRAGSNATRPRHGHAGARRDGTDLRTQNTTRRCCPAGRRPSVRLWQVPHGRRGNACNAWARLSTLSWHTTPARQL
jgi:hypothetical protein